MEAFKFVCTDLGGWFKSWCYFVLMPDGLGQNVGNYGETISLHPWLYQMCPPEKNIPPIPIVIISLKWQFRCICNIPYQSFPYNTKYTNIRMKLWFKSK